MALLKNSERSFYFFDCEVVSGVAGAPLPTMEEIVGIWQSYYSKDRAITPIRKNTAHLVLGDLRIDTSKDIATLLIRLSDLQAPNAVYSDVQRGTYKEHHKSAAEGSDMGAHVLVSTVPEKGSPNVYLAMVEGVPGVTYQEVRRLLNRVLRYQYHDDPSAFEFDDIITRFKNAPGFAVGMEYPARMAVACVKTGSRAMIA
ncbi:MAG: hypothetical protein ABI697_02760, partial [Devosia sp.]